MKWFKFWEWKIWRSNKSRELEVCNRVNSYDDIKRLLVAKKANEEFGDMSWGFKGILDCIVPPLFILFSPSLILSRLATKCGDGDNLRLIPAFAAIASVLSIGGAFEDNEQINMLSRIWWFAVIPVCSIIEFCFVLYERLSRKTKALKEIAQKISSGQVIEFASQYLKEQIQKAREKSLGKDSRVSKLHEEIRSKRYDLSNKKAYFEERIKQGDREIASRALCEIALAERKLELSAESLKRKEQTLADAFARCEHRLPGIVNMLNDNRMIEELQKTVSDIDVVAERVQTLIPETMRELEIEFGRINHVLDATSDKAMALPMPDISGDDIRAVKARFVADEQVFVDELRTIEAEIFTVPFDLGDSDENDLSGAEKEIA